MFDDAGNSGILLVGGVGGGTVNAGFSVTGFYNGAADTIYDLEGQGSSVGGSIGPVGVDMSAEMDSIAVSWGKSAIPLEVHAVITGGVLIHIF